MEGYNKKYLTIILDLLLNSLYSVNYQPFGPNRRKRKGFERLVLTKRVFINILVCNTVVVILAGTG